MQANLRLVAVRGLAALTGLILFVIGLRFLLVPQKAARFFGITIEGSDPATSLSYVVGLRDIWLGLLVILMSAIEDWRGLALWLGLGASVCLGDAAIAVQSGGQLLSVSFHLASGVYCGVLAWICWSEHRKRCRRQQLQRL